MNLSHWDGMQEASTLPTPLLVSILKLSGQFRVHHMATMPPPMHAAAMQAAYPSIAATSTLDLKLTRNPAEVLVLCPIVAQLSSLHSLSITITGDATVNHSTAETFTANLSRSFQNLRGLRKLVLNNFDLEFSYVDPDNAVSALGQHLSELTGLEDLEMTWNRIGADGIGAFCRHLSSLSHLTCFHFEAAGVGPLGAITLGPQIGKLTQLRSLNLYNDRLRVVGIRSLVPNLKKLSCLEYLNLGLNDICNEAALVFAPVLGSLLSLKHLLLARNQINSIQSVRILMHRITNDLPDLETLDLCYNGMYAEAVCELATHFSKLTALSKLALRNPAAQCEFIWPLVPFLGHLSGLRSLNMSVAWLHEMAAEEFAQQVTKLTNLTQLVMQRSVTADGASNIAPIFGELPQLEILDLQGNQLSVDHMVLIMSHASNLTNLRVLDLSKTSIGSQGATLLLQNTSLMNLEDLDLSQTGLTDATFFTFNEKLVNVPKLKRLALADNDIGASFDDPPDHDGFYIVRCSLSAVIWSLHCLPEIQKLDLSGCRFSELSVDVLSTHLPRNTSLQELCLARVQFTDYAINCLAPAFQELLALRSLDFSDNEDITEEGWMLLLNYLSDLPQVMKLYVGSDIDKTVVARLQSATKNVEIFL